MAKPPNQKPPSSVAPPGGAATGPPAAPAGSPTFATVGFDGLPGWAKDDHLAALKAFLVSCPKLVGAARASANSGKASRLQPPPALIAVCEAGLALPEKVTRAEARAFLERSFVPQRVVHAAPEGLLTGYYEPLIEGSRTREGRFQTPIHRRPADLVNVVDEAQRGAVGAKFTHARMTSGGLVPFPTRAEIEGGALNGQGLELLYLADPVDVFFLQIQGSGRIRLTDGTVVRVHYDGKNGHPYTSIGRYLIDKGMLAADKVSMGALGRWLRADPARGRLVMHQNASYVFFRALPDSAKGPLGVLEVPLVAGRSLAVDPSVHTLGAPVYVDAPTLTHARSGEPFQRLMVAHDVGSAIRGPERGDIYFGSGEQAGRIAGVTKHPGHLFVLKAIERPGLATGTSPKPAGASRP